MPEPKVAVVIPVWCSDVPNGFGPVLPTWPKELNISSYVVVDDPYNSGNIAWQTCQNVSDLSLLFRKGRQGVGSAYKVGLLRAYKDGADLVLQYDIGQSVSTALDFIRIGTEFYQRGDRNFLIMGERKDLRFARSWPRAKLSEAATCLVNRLLPPENRVQDATFGLRLWDREAISRMPWEQIVARGYFFNAAALYYALTWAGAKPYRMGVVENPDNKSHLRLQDVVEAGWDYVNLWLEVRNDHKIRGG